MADDVIYLKEWRKFAALTQEQLGEALGITGAQVSRIETGQRDFDGRYLTAFRAAINGALDRNPDPGKPVYIRIEHIGDALSKNPDPAGWLNPALERRWRDLISDIRDTTPVAAER